MSVRNDHELPRSQADVSDDALDIKALLKGRRLLNSLWPLSR